MEETSGTVEANPLENAMPTLKHRATFFVEGDLLELMLCDGRSAAYERTCSAQVCGTERKAATILGRTTTSGSHCQDADGGRVLMVIFDLLLVEDDRNVEPVS